MGTPTPRSTLSGALKIADKVTVTMEAVGDKIRSNSQGWEDARVIGERQVLMFARAWAGQVREHLQDGLHEAPEDFE